MVTVCPSQFATRRTLFHVLVGCGLLMLKVSRLKLPVIWLLVSRSEERRVGKEGRSRWATDHNNNKFDGLVVILTTYRALRFLEPRQNVVITFFFQAEDGIRNRSRHSC